MNQLLPKLKIYGVPYPATATAIIQLLANEKTATRRRFSEAFTKETSSHQIRRTLYRLQVLGLVALSVAGQYRLNLPAKAVLEMTPVKMSKVEHLILRLMNNTGDITTSDVFNAYGIIHPQFLTAARRLIERGIIRSYHQINENTGRYRRYYAFISPKPE